MPGRSWIIIGALLAALAVLAGAFGAHVLKQQVKDWQQRVNMSTLGTTIIPVKMHLNKDGHLTPDNSQKTVTGEQARHDELHALRDAEHKLEVFDTAARNQMIHAIALILVGMACRANGSSPCTRIAGVAFLLGIILFCGWLYANVLWGNVALPFIAPIGGIAFVVGWVALAVSAWRWPAESPR